MEVIYHLKLYTFRAHNPSKLAFTGCVRVFVGTNIPTQCIFRAVVSNTCTTNYDRSFNQKVILMDHYDIFFGFLFLRYDWILTNLGHRSLSHVLQFSRCSKSCCFKPSSLHVFNWFSSVNVADNAHIVILRLVPRPQWEEHSDHVDH